MDVLDLDVLGLTHVNLDNVTTYNLMELAVYLEEYNVQMIGYVLVSAYNAVQEQDVHQISTVIMENASLQIMGHTDRFIVKKLAINLILRFLLKIYKLTIQSNI